MPTVRYIDPYGDHHEVDIESGYTVNMITAQPAAKQREVVRINSIDANARGIESEGVMRVFNDRGSCLAAAVIDDNLRASV